MTTIPQAPDPQPPETARRPAHRRGPRPPAAPRRVWLTALGTGAVAAVAATLLAPQANAPEVAFTGDDALVEDLEAVLDPALVHSAVVVRFPVGSPETLELAVGDEHGGTVTADTPFETGSVQKTFTAMALADMVEDGETSLDRTLAEVFPEAGFADDAVAEATLEDLATHTSGLPTTPAGSTWDSFVLPGLAITGPYGNVTPPVEALATTPAAAPTAATAEFTYSNLGYALLGAAMERESGGTPYAELVRERVFDPLGMDDTGPHRGRGVPEGAARPHVEPGSPVQPWHGADYAPAGVGTWTTAGDLVRFMTAVTDGSAPGLSALRPVHTGVPAAGGDRSVRERDGHDQGLAWMMREVDGLGRVTEHSGATFGSHAMLAFDGTRAVAVLGNAPTVNAPGVAYALLAQDPEPPAPLLGRTWGHAMAAMTVAMALTAPLLLVALAARRRTLVTQRPIDRLRVVSLSLGALAWVLLSLRAGTWIDLPMAVWGAAVGLTVAGLVVGSWHWPGIPGEAARWRRVHVPVFAVSVLLSLSVASAAVWGFVASYV